MLAPAVAFALVIDTLGMLSRCPDWHLRLLQQLKRLFIHAQHRMFRIVGFGVGFEHIFHGRDELGVLFRWADPVDVFGAASTRLPKLLANLHMRLRNRQVCAAFADTTQKASASSRLKVGVADSRDNCEPP